MPFKALTEDARPPASLDPLRHRPRSAFIRLAVFVDRFQFVILLAAAPFFLFPSALGLVALLLLPAVWLAAWIAHGTPLPKTPLNGALLVLSLMVLVSLYATYSIEVSLPKITGILLGIASYLAMAGWLDRPRRLRLAIQLFILAGGGLGLLSLLGTDWASKFSVVSHLVGHLPRVIQGLAGPSGGFPPNEVGGTLVLFVPLQLTALAATWE